MSSRAERFVRGALALLRGVHPEAAWRLGRGLGAVVGGLPLRDARRAREHLLRAFPERGAAWAAATARAAFAHFGGMALLTLVSSQRPGTELRRGVSVIGGDNLRETIRASRRGEGTVVFSGHFGDWELLARTCGSFLPLTVIGRRLRSPLADALVRALRQGGPQARAGYQDEDARGFLGELRQGRIVATLADQDIPRLAGVFVPWFGIPAWTPVGPAMLAMASGAGVQAAFCYRLHGRWVAQFGPRRRFPRGKDRSAAANAITAWATAYEEALLRRHPGQWVWWHKRWRTRPEAAPASLP